MNKYEKVPEEIIDLHGDTRDTAGVVLKDLLKEKKYSHVRIITGSLKHMQGICSADEANRIRLGRDFLKNYLEKHHIKYSQSKLSDGGEGAFEVFLR